MLADEVEHQACRLSRRRPQPATQLLGEQHRALGGAQQEERVHVGGVNAFPQHVNTEDHLKVTRVESRHHFVALGLVVLDL